MKIITDAQKIEEILTRGVENIYPNREFLAERLRSGERLTLYTGYDPTAPSLHIGHAITMMKLKQFQDLGHRVIMLIGDFTGLIGDPTDKSSARKQLTDEEVKNNFSGWKKQAAAILNFDGPNPVEIKYNSEWHKKMTFEDVVNLSSHFTVQRMLERDMFQERIGEGKPVYLHEFMYPLMQGYDSVAMDVDGEVGGNDQTFNMLAGRDLMKDLKNKEKFVLTTKLLADTGGKKMGKSEGNAVFLTDLPEDIFGKVMSWTDGMIAIGFELCTELSIEEIAIIIKENENPRDQKLRLAYEVVKTFAGEISAGKAKDYFINTFSKKEAPEDILTVEAGQVIDALLKAKICRSKSEARQVIDQGGVKINDKKIDKGDYTVIVNSGDIIQKGSRWFVKIK